MSRLSRVPVRSLILLVLGIATFVALESFYIYLFILNRHMTRELVSHSWRQPTVIVSVAGGGEREVARVYGADWRATPPVRLEAMPRHVSDAFLAAEDVRFRRHPGIDPIGMTRALIANVKAGGITQGGSTIDQQVVKMRYLSYERTWRRKAVEMILAVVLDARLSKDDILELYLNDVYLGHYSGTPVLGVDEASRVYFNKTPDALTVDEAALLASVVRAPNRDNPQKRPDLARSRRDSILRVMRDREWISTEQYDKAVRRNVDFAEGSLPLMPFPYYSRAIRNEVVRRLGMRRVLEGGLTIVSEIDADGQRVAERLAKRAPAQLQSRFGWIRAQARQDPLQVAILSIDPRSGGIRTLVGGSDYQRSAFDRTSSMRRQPGSAFKTFAYLAAIASKRATTASLLLDSPLTVKLAGDQVWEPQNYDERYRGRVTLRESFEKSLNVPTVRLMEHVGLRRVVRTIDNFEFSEDVEAIPALPLGVTDVTMRELTAAYTAFPNLGMRVEPYLLTAVRDRKGKTLFQHEGKSKRVCDAASAYIMHTLLRGVVKRGTASRLKRYGLSHVAGKTGTTNDYRDAWFVGYTPDRVTTVWVGFDHGAPLRLSSAEAAIPIWGAYMAAVPHDRGDVEAPNGVTFRDVDPETGTLWGSGCPGPLREVFLDGTAPTRHCPRGVIGEIVRRVFFDSENFDEPAAITFDKFRKLANEVDRNRKEVEGVMERLRRFFRDD